MAWQKINHSCGHTSEDQFYGPEKVRAERLAREENRPCDACAKAAWIEAHQNDPPEAHIRRIQPDKIAPNTWRIEIIVLRSFSLREELKARGYHFGEFALNPDIFAGTQAFCHGGIGLDEFKRISRGSKGWSVIFSAADPSEKALEEFISKFQAEVIWLGQHGCSIVEKVQTDPFQQCAAAWIEGRPDLAYSV